jgi:hypothetical protein
MRHEKDLLLDFRIEEILYLILHLFAKYRLKMSIHNLVFLVPKHRRTC